MKWQSMEMKKIICDDAITWFENYDSIELNSTVSSLPDYSEFAGWSIDQWKNWFISTSELIINKTSDEGVSIFYQTDIKHNGEWIDKSFLIQKAAEKANSKLIWHKIICRVPPDLITFGRPAYTHILCFSKKFQLDHSKSTADVISHVGEKIWERGMGLEACLMITKFLKNHVRPEIVINPFCGQGSLVSVLEAFDLNVIGIEKGAKRARAAEKMKYNDEVKKWI